MEIKGIDVSAHQGVIDWARVAEGGVQFAMIRLGIGSRKDTPTHDRRFHVNVEGALAAGVNVGVYLYSYALDAVNAKREAEFALRSIEQYRNDITHPVVFDIEDKTQAGLSKSVISAMCDVFCATIGAAGFKPMVYANLDWVRNRLDVSLWEKYDLWLAHWAAKPGRECAMWQHTDKGRVPGISGPVDCNIGYVDYGTSTPEQPPAPTRPTLRPGDQREEVALLYHLLNSRGYIVGDKFNQPLEAAVKAFQGKEGLHVDGVVGERTWAAIDKLIAEATINERGEGHA